MCAAWQIDDVDHVEGRSSCGTHGATGVLRSGRCLFRRVDDVHLGDAGVGSREGDDAGPGLVTVEYAKASVAVDVEDFEAFGGCGLGRQSAQEVGYPLLHHAHVRQRCADGQVTLGVAAEEGVRMRVVGLHWLMPLTVDDVVRGADATGRRLVVHETGKAVASAGNRHGARRGRLFGGRGHPGGQAQRLPLAGSSTLSAVVRRL